MNLISFDIGIKNMAYCIFCIDASNNLSIRDWNVLNLMDIEQPDPKCSCKNIPKSKKASATNCTSNAKYNKNNVYYCEKHAKSSPFLIPKKSLNLKKMKLEDLVKLGNSHLLFMDVENIEKINKKTLKKGEIIDKIDDFLKKQSLEPIIKKKSKTANDTDLIKIGKNMKNSLNQVLENVDTTNVIIENQISPIANRMKTIQGMLAQYFIIKDENITIDFVSSSNKLKQFDIKKIKTNENILENTMKPAEKPLENSFEKNIKNPDYKKHKIDGVSYCSRILSVNEFLNRWITSLDTKKKDDLADCFLQGLWYLKQKNIIFYAEDLKIKIV
uniref:Mitochondrial resolvase Ydc2 catalytic domain-containing protein n=1 Tax=viral metagenome TaxID=1070528 RepID=A0A6C0DCH5_9ZZZZ